VTVTVVVCPTGDFRRRVLLVSGQVDEVADTGVGVLAAPVDEVILL
jgi:hypothetical protein